MDRAQTPPTLPRTRGAVLYSEILKRVAVKAKMKIGCRRRMTVMSATMATGRMSAATPVRMAWQDAL